MSFWEPRDPLCNCGSGQQKRPVYDARGIFVTYACDECEVRKLSSYRREIFTNGGYWAHEDIEPEEDVYPEGWESV